MNIIIADDHTLFREMCEEYIARKRPNIKILTAKDYDGAIEILKTTPNIDLIILDLCMPGMDGINGIANMRKFYADIPVTIISGVAREDDVEACIKAGAKGFFPKTLSGRALISAIELVLSGEIFVPVDYKAPPELPPLTEQSKNIDKALKNAGIRLTKREREMLGFLVQAASNQEIADELGLKLVTIKLHIKGACRKLGAKNRTQAALRAKELGFK